MISHKIVSSAVYGTTVGALTYGYCKAGEKGLLPETWLYLKSKSKFGPAAGLSAFTISLCTKNPVLRHGGTALSIASIFTFIVIKSLRKITLSTPEKSKVE